MHRFLFILLATVFLPVLATAQTIDKIKSSGTIVIGFRTDAAPLSYLADNSPQGYTPTICFELAAYIGKSVGLTDLNVIFESVDTENRFDLVESGEIDLLCGAATITLSRMEQVDFSDPVYVDGTTVALKKDAPEQFADLAGQKIGVRSGTTTLEALQTSLAAQNIEADVIQFDDHPSGMAALEGDVIMAYFADQSILMNMVRSKGNASDFKVFDELLTIEKQGLAMRRGDTEFRLLVNAGLSSLYASGVMRQAFDTTIPGATPGLAIEAMYLLAPTLP